MEESVVVCRPRAKKPTEAMSPRDDVLAAAVPDGGEHEEDDGDAGDEPHDAHLQLQQPVPQAGEPAPRHLPVWAAAAAVHSVFSTFEDHAFLFMFKV